MFSPIKVHTQIGNCNLVIFVCMHILLSYCEEVLLVITSSMWVALIIIVPVRRDVNSPIK